MAEKAKEDAKEAGKQEFAIQRIYVKDLSFEAPNAPEIFKSQLQPDVNLDINVTNNKLEDGVYEVVLQLTATVKHGKPEDKDAKTAFLAEVKQAGIFTLKGFEDDALDHLLKSYCAGVLYPYARQEIAYLSNAGSFQALNLAPINFDVLFEQQKENEKKQKQDDKTKH